MAQGITGESLKQAFNDFQAYRKAGKVVVDSVLLRKIAEPFSLKSMPRDHTNLTDGQKKHIKRHYAQEFHFNNLPSYLNKWLPIYGIDTAIRVAHFLSQSCCETFNFAEVTENTDGLKYEPGTNKGRLLGNTNVGDGPAFIGRGLLHLTGRGNYTKMSGDLKIDLVKSPDLVASNLDLCVRTACEYWRNRGINAYADRDDFDKITVIINGGHTGLKERREALKRAKKYLGLV